MDTGRAVGSPYILDMTGLFFMGYDDGYARVLGYIRSHPGIFNMAT